MNIQSKVTPSGRIEASVLDIKFVAFPSDHCTATVSGKTIKLTTLKVRVTKSIAVQTKSLVLIFVGIFIVSNLTFS